MNFKFRFETLLELRRRERDEAGAEVGQANEAIRRVDEQREALKQQRVDLRLSPSASRKGNVSVDRLLTAGRYDIQLEADAEALSDTRGKLIQELARRQEKLKQAEAELKRFEKLREHEKSSHQAELLRREQAEADDATNRRFAMIIQRKEAK